MKRGLHRKRIKLAIAAITELEEELRSLIDDFDTPNSDHTSTCQYIAAILKGWVPDKMVEQSWSDR